MIFFTNLFVKEGFAGITIGVFIFIRPQYKDDIGLIEHEKVHVRQFLANPLFYGLRYLLSAKCRLAYEVEAYRVQLTYCKDREISARWFAKRISEGYRLDVTQERAYELLTCP